MVAEYLGKVNWDVRIAFLMQAVKTNKFKNTSDAAGILWEPDGKFDNCSQGKP